MLSLGLLRACLHLHRVGLLGYVQVRVLEGVSFSLFSAGSRLRRAAYQLVGHPAFETGVCEKSPFRNLSVIIPRPSPSCRLVWMLCGGCGSWPDVASWCMYVSVCSCSIRIESVVFVSPSMPTPIAATLICQ